MTAVEAARRFAYFRALQKNLRLYEAMHGDVCGISQLRRHVIEQMRKLAKLMRYAAVALLLLLSGPALAQDAHPHHPAADMPLHEKFRDCPLEARSRGAGIIVLRTRQKSEPRPFGRGSLPSRLLEEVRLYALAERHIQTAGEFLPLLDLSDASGIHAKLRCDPVLKFTPTQRPVNLDRIFEGESGTWPPHLFALFAHSGPR